MYYQKNEEKETNIIISAPDRTLIFAVTFLIVIGIMSVFSSGSARAIAEGSSPVYYLIRHILWLMAGIFGCWFCTRFDYKKLRPLAFPLALFVLVMLILTAYTPLGVTVNGARRWLNLGVQFQPSEFSKLALILCLADAFSKNIDLLDKAKFPYYCLFAGILLLIFKQPNLSMTMLLCMCAMAMYYCAGGKLKYILISIAIAVPAVLLRLTNDYQRQRLLIWLDPKSDPRDAGYNIIQSLVAFAGGGFFGVGYGNSKQKLSWLPEGHTDFIFSIIAEEFGFLGCFFVVVLFMIFIRRGLIIATRCPDIFGKLLAFGITFSIGAQAFINMGVASSFLPASGIPLPFISYGGSSLFISLCMLGILLNISRKKVQRIVPIRYSDVQQ